MDAFEAIRSKLDFREFSTKDVPQEIKLKVLEAARLTGTGLNTQHWRFILDWFHTNITHHDLYKLTFTTRCNSTAIALYLRKVDE
jgi:hypothetical protein